VLLRPYYNLVILERKAEEAYHAMPRPGWTGRRESSSDARMCGRCRGMYPTCHANRSTRQDAGDGTALISRRLEVRVTTRLGFCLTAEPTGMPNRSAALTTL